MKITVERPVTIEVDSIRCVLPLNYDDEDMPRNYPHRKGDMWDVTINVASGQIIDWPAGVEPLDLYMKVVDGGRYYLLRGGEVVASREEDYVPKAIPGEWGDYVDFQIEANGRITNWAFDTDDIGDQFDFTV